MLCIDDADIMIRYYFIMNGSENPNNRVNLSGNVGDSAGIYRR